MSMADGAMWFLWAALLYWVVFWGRVFVCDRKDSTPWWGTDFSDVKPWLEDLLKRGYDGAYTRFGDRKSGLTLRFEKYLRGKGDYGIRLVFDPAPVGQDLIQKLTDYCEREDLPTEARDAQDGSGEMPILVDCGKDAGKAYALAREAWLALYGLTESTGYDREGGGLLHLDQLVNDPDHPRYSQREVQEHVSKETSERLASIGLTKRTMLGGAVLMLLFAVATIGLPLSIWFSMDAAPQWEIDLGPVKAGGSVASLALMTAHILCVAFARSLKGRLKFPASEPSRYEKTFTMLGHLFLKATPIAVVLIWVDV